MTLIGVQDTQQTGTTAPGERGDPLRPDAALVAEALSGRTAAYEALVRRYERAARATCFAVLHDWHSAQDAAQDAFVGAYTNLRSLRDGAAFGTWLLTMAHRRALRVARATRRHRRHRPIESVPDRAGPPARPARSDGLFGLVAGLPEHERVVVLLRYVDGHDVAAIARICGRPVGTVTKQLSRAHARLEGLLRDWEDRWDR